MQSGKHPRLRRWAPIFGAAALWVSSAAVLCAATEHVVHVGQGGMKFVDEASGTNVTTIAAGDTVKWVWEGTMNHGVTAGVCLGGGGGGGGYVVSPGYGNGDCIPSNTWQSATMGSGATFSHTFAAEGTFTYFCPVHLSAMTGKVVVQPAATSGPCDETEAESLCLNGGRFRVTAEWEKPDGTSGHGTGIRLTGDSGYFWFFDPANIEAVVKVLNGCAITNAYWVFGAGLTNVAVHLVVTDTQTGAVYTRDNTQGSAFLPVQDTTAFPASCP